MNITIITPKYAEDLDEYFKIAAKAFGNGEAIDCTKAHLDMLYNHGIMYYVGMMDKKVVCGLKVLLDWKVARNAYAAHIEDVCVAEDYQGKGIASKFLREVIARLKKKFDIYKFILDCDLKLAGFYRSIGFYISKDVHLRMDV